jgi:hypothetical protein
VVTTGDRLFMTLATETKAVRSMLHMQDCLTLAAALLRKQDKAKARDMLACLVKLAHDAHRDLR